MLFPTTIVGSLVTGVGNHVVSVLGVYLLGEAMGGLRHLTGEPGGGGHRASS